ncbi:MAG: ABC transporter substrate-binding protein [Acetobacteraceae bacterium]
MKIGRRLLNQSLLAGAASAALPGQGRAADKILRVAMTAADIPLTTGQASQGGEGVRFMGVTAYDALVNWDLSRSDVAAKLRPGLALSWAADPERTTVWTFKLRQGVTFHDGSPFTAESVVWNLDKLIKRDSPQYDQAQATQAATWSKSIASYAVVDPFTVRIETPEPNANLPYDMASIFMSSPKRWEELGRDWTKVAMRPAGTGPWMVTKVVPRERVEFARNPNYWEARRIPKCDGLVIIPMPDSVTRVSALLNGQIDWVEAPAPDTLAQLRQAGMQIVLNPYPHIWPYLLSCLPDSPFRDLRVRQAMNLAIDRDGICTLLNKTAMPAVGMVPPDHPWFGNPSFKIRYDPDTARKLLSDAGFGPKNPCKATFLISTAGSGQMQPLPMNEAIKESLEDVGFAVTLQAMDWEALRARRRAGAAAPENKGGHALNNSLGTPDPTAFIQIAWSKLTPPLGINWGWFKDPEVDGICQAINVAFDQKEQDALLGKLHTKIVDNALWAFVVHDLNPRAMSPKVKGFVQAQSWQQDLTPVDLV